MNSARVRNTGSSLPWYFSHDRFHRLGLDPGLRRVVHAARQVAMCVCRDNGWNNRMVDLLLCH